MTHTNQWGPRPEVATDPTRNHPKKKMRYKGFIITFLVIQALFVLWLITGIHAAQSGATCEPPLTAQDCKDATDVGTTIGAGLIIGLWFFVDFLLGLGLSIYHLARGRR